MYLARAVELLAGNLGLDSSPCFSTTRKNREEPGDGKLGLADKREQECEHEQRAKRGSPPAESGNSEVLQLSGAG